METIQDIFFSSIRQIRKSKKMSQQDVAEKSNMLASTYNRIENRKVSPSIDTVLKIAKALEVPFINLFQSDEIIDKSITQKLHMIENLSSYNKNVIEVMIDTVIEKDQLEKLQNAKMKSRLAELNKTRDDN